MIQHNLKEMFQDQGFTHYTEIRSQKSQRQLIQMQQGVTNQNISSEDEGTSVRVRKDGAWGFAAGSDQGKKNLEKLLGEAQDNAFFLSRYQKDKKAPTLAMKSIEKKSLLEREEHISQSELLDFAKEVDAMILKHCPLLSSRNLVLQRLQEEKMLYTSEDIFAHTLLPRILLSFQLFMEDKQGGSVSLGQSLGGLGSLRDHFQHREKIREEILHYYEMLRHKAEGVIPKAGLQDVILDSDLAGILAHEAVGHTVEADLVNAGSVAGPLFGKQVASDLVTMVDFAHTAFGEIAPIPVFVDDEGVEAKDAVLIDQGRLNAFMHNRESAEEYAHEALGNARASAWYDEPLIRMRNTCILPGKHALEELISSVDEGYYLMNPSNGQADTTGEFMFGVMMGYEIKQGKLGRAIKDTTISGIAFDVLKKVSMVSHDLTWISSGMCGKKQAIAVGMGGPALRTKLFVGGES